MPIQRITNVHLSTHAGLWVKAKEEATLSSSSTTNTSLKGAGRGGGIPVFNPMHNVNTRDEGGQAAVYDEFDYKAKKKRSDDRHDPDGKRVDSRDRYRDASRDSFKRDRSSERSSLVDSNRHRRDSRDRDRSRDRHRDSGERDRDSSYNKRPRGDRADSRDHRDKDRDRYEQSSSSASSRRADDREYLSSKRHRSRSPSPVSHRETKPLTSNQEGARFSRHTSDKEADDESVATQPDEASPFSFSAIQIVNRFLEVFASPTPTPAQRLDSIIELFDEHAVIASLKTEKPLLTAIEAIRASFAKTTATTGIECSRRLYIPYKPAPNTTRISTSTGTGTGTETGIDSKYSYTLDFHTPGSSPGLGDPNKDTVLLYQCNENTSKIVHIWGTVDTDILASKVAVTESDVYKCNIWKWVLLVLQKQEPEVEIGTRDMYFHDYTNIETI